MKKSIVLIDGGHLRSLTKKSGRSYTVELVEKVGLASAVTDEEIHRILYYDCAPYSGAVTLPVSGKKYFYTGKDGWLSDLSKKDLFAVRRGVLKFRGFKPKSLPISPTQLTDSDFVADFEQKGVDMRIGLDMASYSQDRCVDRIILMTNDTDCIPAMKHGRKAGIQVVICTMVGGSTTPELLSHADFSRAIPWPV